MLDEVNLILPYITLVLHGVLVCHGSSFTFDPLFAIVIPDHTILQLQFHIEIELKHDIDSAHRKYVISSICPTSPAGTDPFLASEAQNNFKRKETRLN